MSELARLPERKIPSLEPPMSDDRALMEDWAFAKATRLGTTSGHGDYFRVITDECVGNHHGRCQNPHCWCVCHES